MAERKVVPFHLTKLDPEGRTFEGYASTFRNPQLDQPDLTGDMVIRGAFAKTLVERGGKIRLLWQHDTSAPIGRIVSAHEDDRGLFVKALVSPTALGTDAMALLKDGAIDSMSIGYDAMPGGTEYAKGSNGTSMRLLKEVRLWEVSLATFPADEQALVTAVKAAVPFKATDKAPEGEAWSAPTLSDFTDKTWGDLTDAEKRGIMAHYAWTANNPPESFGDLKFPHHRPSDMAVVWAACGNAMARMSQAQIPDADMAGVRSHLAGHYRQFDKPMPGEASAKAFRASDFVTSFNQELTRQGLWEAHWRIEPAFDSAIDSILSDEAMDGAAKLAMIGSSCTQYGQALTDWAARVIAVSGKAAGEPSEVKVGRRLSTSSVNKIRAALAALTELLGEEPAQNDSDITDEPAKQDDKAAALTVSGNTVTGTAPGVTIGQVAVTDTASAKAGPGASSPTADAAGPNAQPPTSNDAPQLDIDAEIKSLEALLEAA